MMDIRKKIIQKRQALTEKQLQDFEQVILRALQAHPRYQQSQKVACYISMEGEVPTQALIQDLLRYKLCYLPVITHFEKNQMVFRQLGDLSELRANAYGVWEPSLGPEIAVQDLDLLILPLLAFDAKGHRLGRGRGFYDRYLAGAGERPYRLGLAYDFQEVPDIQPEPWDVSVHEVLKISTLPTD